MTVEDILRGRHTVGLTEAARLLGVGKSTVWEGMKRGEVPNAGIGSAKRVPVWWLLKKLMPPNEV